MNLFGKKKKAAPKLSDSIHQLRDALNVLDKREKYLEKQMNTCVADAKRKMKAKDKRGALFQLKRKKMYEKQLDQIYGKKSNIDMQILALEGAASNKELISAMATGRTALQSAVRETDVDNVADVMDQINESMQLADEMGEAMAQPIGPIMDEDELTAELDELEEQMMDEQLTADVEVPTVTAPAETSTSGPILDAPSAPAGRIVETQEQKEARELKELEALMDA